MLGKKCPVKTMFHPPEIHRKYLFGNADFCGIPNKTIRNASKKSNR